MEMMLGHTAVCLAFVITCLSLVLGVETNSLGLVRTTLLVS